MKRLLLYALSIGLFISQVEGAITVKHESKSALPKVWVYFSDDKEGYENYLLAKGLPEEFAKLTEAISGITEKGAAIIKKVTPKEEKAKPRFEAEESKTKSGEEGLPKPLEIKKKPAGLKPHEVVEVVGMGAEIAGKLIKLYAESQVSEWAAQLGTINKAYLGSEALLANHEAIWDAKGIRPGSRIFVTIVDPKTKMPIYHGIAIAPNDTLNFIAVKDEDGNIRGYSMQEWQKEQAELKK
jgi:hypothetical protein